MMTPISSIDGGWLCAVALWESGWGSAEELASASLAWLPAAPGSEALYHLADDALRQTTRSTDIWAWIDEVFEDVGCPKPSSGDFRWIATYSMVQRGWTARDGEEIVRFLSSLAVEADVEQHDLDERKLLNKYRLYDFEMDDGIALNWPQILEELNRETKPALLEGFSRHFASRPDMQWVPDLLGAGAS